MALASLSSLGDDAIRLGAQVDDWRAAIRLAGDVLQQIGAVTESYSERMVQIVEEYGSYIVIAPGLALAHARPGPDVLRGGLSVVTLARPVPFGHPHNDPVSVVLGLSVLTSHDHVNQVAELANVFNDPTAISRLAAAATNDEVREVFSPLGLDE